MSQRAPTLGRDGRGVVRPGRAAIFGARFGAPASLQRAEAREIMGRRSNPRREIAFWDRN